MSCCNSCASGGACSGPRIGGTSVSFPGRAFVIPTRSANAPVLGVGRGLGAFWDAYLDPKELKAETFTKAFEAGLKTPRAQAIDLSQMLDARMPSFDVPRFEMSESRPLSEIAASVPQFTVQDPGYGYGGSSGGGGVSRSGMLIGLGVAAAAFFVIKSKLSRRAARPAA